MPFPTRTPKFYDILIEKVRVMNRGEVQKSSTQPNRTSTLLALLQIPFLNFTFLVCSVVSSLITYSVRPKYRWPKEESFFVQTCWISTIQNFFGASSVRLFFFFFRNMPFITVIPRVVSQ